MAAFCDRFVAKNYAITTVLRYHYASGDIRGRVLDASVASGTEGAFRACVQNRSASESMSGVLEDRRAHER